MDTITRVGAVSICALITATSASTKSIAEWSGSWTHGGTLSDQFKKRKKTRQTATPAPGALEQQMQLQPISRNYLTGLTSNVPIPEADNRSPSLTINFSTGDLKKLVPGSDHTIDREIVSTSYRGSPQKRDLLLREFQQRYQGAVLEKLITTVEKKTGKYIGGLWAEATAKKIARELRTLNPGQYTFSIQIPRNFLVDSMELVGVVSTGQNRVTLYQLFEGTHIKLAEQQGVGFGGIHKDRSTGKYRPFNTPLGTLYSSRIFMDALDGKGGRKWIPPSWAKESVPQSGRKSAFGDVAIEMTKFPYRVGRGNKGSDGTYLGQWGGTPQTDSGYDGINLHMSWKVFGEKSHGCGRMIRGKIKDIAQTIFSFAGFGPQYESWVGPHRETKLIPWHFVRSTYSPIETKTMRVSYR